MVTKKPKKVKPNWDKKLRPAMAGVSAPEGGRAYLILKYAHDTARASLDAFEAIRKHRGAKSGTTTDEEQDLLRAALVFAAAGLDSMLKQAIKDCLPNIAFADERAKMELEKYLGRKLRAEVHELAEGTPQMLSRILMAQSPRDQVVEEYVNGLVGSSLQSPEELVKAVKALGINPSQLGVRLEDLRPVFWARNQIIHELDIDFAHPNRNRRSRSRGMMTTYANRLLRAAEERLKAIDDKCSDVAMDNQSS